jgi:hypothetical protein
MKDAQANMNANVRIQNLRELVRAANEEFDAAIRYHETWKPAAYDRDLHRRVSHSYAGNSFLIIRTALRRELLLALARLWDTNPNAVRMSKIAAEVADDQVIEALAAECAAQWGKLPSLDLREIPTDEQAEFIAAAEESEAEFGREMAGELRKAANEAVQIIRKYQEGGAGHQTIEKLTDLRHQRLAHRQVAPAEVTLEDDAPAIELLYQDMATLIRLLLHVVLRTSYEPRETVGVFAHHARFFWAGVRGERTEGHPNYKEPRRSNPPF